MIISFWKWLFRGVGDGPPGYKNVIDGYLAAHVAIALIAVIAIRDDPFSFAAKALFPASSILIGASLAWSTRANSIIQSKEFADAVFRNERPAEDYIYGFQLSFLIVISMVAYVGIMAGGGIRYSVFGDEIDSKISGFVMYFILSLSLRECWGIVNFTNLIGLLEYRRPK